MTESQDGGPRGETPIPEETLRWALSDIPGFSFIVIIIIIFFYFFSLGLRSDILFFLPPNVPQSHTPQDPPPVLVVLLLPATLWPPILSSLLPCVLQSQCPEPKLPSESPFLDPFDPAQMMLETRKQAHTTYSDMDGPEPPRVFAHSGYLPPSVLRVFASPGGLA